MLVGIVGNSDKRKEVDRPKVEKLVRILKENKIDVEVSPVLYIDDYKKKAEVFNSYYKKNMDYLIDVSGGDLANEVLNLIDFDLVKNSKTVYMGYSDNTCIIDAILKMTGKKSLLYQARNIVYNDELANNFINYLLHEDKTILDFKYRFIKGSKLEGVVVGGNIRCLLKLNGMKYFPDFKDKILFLESLGGSEVSIRSLFATYMNLGIFDEIKGLVLGNFTNLEETGVDVLDLIKLYYPKDKVLIKTDEIGHQLKSKALVIGGFLEFK